MPPNEPFIFFDSDTLITGELARLDVDFARPSASMRREGLADTAALRPGYTEIWQSLYDRFGLDFTASLDLDQPTSIGNAICISMPAGSLGADPRAFAGVFWNTRPRSAMSRARRWPARPSTHGLAGGAAVDRARAWRRPPRSGAGRSRRCGKLPLPQSSLLYAREPDAVLDLIEELVADPRIAPLLQGDEAVARLIKGGEGRRVIRPIFAGQNPPATEQAMRHRLRRDGLWFR